MVRRIIILVVFGFLALLTACTVAEGKTMETSITPDKPLIDKQVPTIFETASFALG